MRLNKRVNKRGEEKLNCRIEKIDDVNSEGQNKKYRNARPSVLIDPPVINIIIFLFCNFFALSCVFRLPYLLVVLDELPF